jgi:3-oxoacyl-[acyl-carrier protein] reductase
MNLNLDGRKVLITGGSRGIGLATAKEFRAEGASCLICARTDKDVRLAAEEADCVGVVADVTTADGVKALQLAADSQFGKSPDVIVCNVGSGRSVPPGQETADEWQRIFDINLFSATRVIEAFSSGLSEGAVIACVSSIAARLSTGAPVAYSAAKRALEAMIANLAQPLGRRGVRIFGVAPGNVMFPGSVWERISGEKPADVKQMLENDVPLQRFGTPEEVAQMIVFLSSMRAGFVTGSVHLIDGGQARGV